jgi:hypothetical protein
LTSNQEFFHHSGSSHLTQEGPGFGVWGLGSARAGGS